MNFVAILFLLTTLLGVRHWDKCLINPITITSFVWLFLLIGYQVIDHGLYPLSNLFYVAFLAWMIPFQLACFMMAGLNNMNLRHPVHPASPMITNKYVILFISICIIIVVFMNYKRAMHYDSSNLYHSLRSISIEARRGDISLLPSAIQVFANRFAQIGYVMCLIYLLRDVKFKYKNCFYLLVFVYLFFGANKLVILRFLFGCLAVLVYKNKLNVKLLLMVFALICLSMFALQFLRREDTTSELDIISLLNIYIFSPLPAFDYYILNTSSNFVTYFDGEFVFKNFPIVDYFVNGNYDSGRVSYYNYDMVYVPLPTNVYTMLSGYWVGWKWSGLIIGGLLHGCFWGYIYERAKNTEIYKILYASIIYILFFYFFYDYLTGEIKFNITLILFLFCLFYNPMFKSMVKK